MNTCIVFSSDHNYIRQTCLTISSYALSNHSKRGDIYVIVDESVTNHDKDHLKRTSDVFSIELGILQLDSSWKSNIPQPFFEGWRHVSPVAFAKLLAIDLIPSSYERCMILDTDLLVIDSLEELFSISLEGYPIAAVKDFMMPEARGRRLSLSDPETYFNSGVLIIDSKKWKKIDPISQIASIDKALISNLIFLEQDLLNLIFEKRYLELKSCFNHMVMVSLSGEIPNPINKDTPPKIIHFPGQIKPWHEYCPKRIQEFYMMYSKVCGWIGMTLKVPTSKDDLRLAATLSKNLGNQILFEKYGKMISQIQ